MTKIFLKPHREESLLRYHPWVFSGAIANVQGNPAEGDLVTVCAADGQQLAIGHWQIGSIAVRVLSFSGDPTAPDFCARRSSSMTTPARPASGSSTARETAFPD